jgi:hypothetical protein
MSDCGSAAALYHLLLQRCCGFQIYGEALVIREDADYAVEIVIDLDMAEMALRQARRFVRRMHEYLRAKGVGDELAA